MRIRTSFVCIVASALTLTTVSSAAELQTFSYQEPFGLAHSRQILEMALTKPVDAANCRLLDAKGNDVPLQVSLDGKRLLLRTDLAAREMKTWRLVEGKPVKAPTDQKFVTI